MRLQKPKSLSSEFPDKAGEGFMKGIRWQSAARSSADPVRANLGFEGLLGTEASAVLAILSEESLKILAALIAGSQAMTVLLSKHPEWIQDVLTPENLAYPRKEQGLQREVNSWLPPLLARKDYAGAFEKLRQFKQREMLRIAARDLARLTDALQTIREISNVADVCLSATLELCESQLSAKLGQPYHQDADGVWRPSQFTVLGLGKLGGQELNYSSDVDIIFVYTEEGHVFKKPPRRKVSTERALSNHQYFKRLAEAFINEVSRVTPDGAMYRIDLRLRPEGNAGPLVRSLGSYENFYSQWGQTWERMMLIKARGVAGDAALAAEFLDMAQPFRYPRSLGEGVLSEIATMKTRIENEVVKNGEMDRNVKLGRGGIREIEFIVQTAQVLNAGRIPFLQSAQTLPTLEKLAQYKLLSAGEARDLGGAYCFLRDIEHRLQMENNLQTHTIPTDRSARERLARLMGFSAMAGFDRRLKRHHGRVRQIYDKLVQGGVAPRDSSLPAQFGGAEAEWKRLLAGHDFKDVDKSLRLLNEFAHGPGYVHVSQRTTDLAMKLVPKILALCRDGVPAPPPVRQALRPDANRGIRPAGAFKSHGRLSDPDRVLARLDSFITAYGARTVMFETWNSNPQIFELLLLLFDRSEFLAEIAIRTPDLVDDLVLSRRLGRSKDSEEILKDLRHGRDDSNQKLWLRRYHQAEFMRIGLRSILGLADHGQNFLELSALADACLQYALEVALQHHGVEGSPLAIIGLGKLGGRELNYGSDLDIIFVADDSAKKSPAKLQKVAVEVMDLLSSPTELGTAFVTDARLRPDGEKGLLVNTLASSEAYYRQRAQLWEIQALTRSRPVAGDLTIGDKFQRFAIGLTDFRESRGAPGESKARTVLPRPSCYADDWKQQLARMRQRIEKERTPAGQDALAFKTGRGGIIDAEFIAQAMCLEHGWHEPNTLCAVQRIRGDRVLPVTEADKLLDNYRKLRRLESILRRWSFEGETVLPTDPAAFHRVAIRCGFESSEAFSKTLAAWRRSIREVYDKVFGG